MNLQALYNDAIAQHRQGNLAEAERLYRTLLQSDGRNAGILYLLGVALAQQGRNDKALESLNRSIAANPNIADAIFARGQILLALGRPGHALSDIEQALTLAPGNAAILTAHGNALFAAARFEQAVQSLDRALAINASNAEALNNRGNALRALGRGSEALESYNRALCLNGNYFDALYNRAGLYRELGRYDAALADFDGALRVKPDSIEALTGRARSLRGLGRPEEALEAYRLALTRAPAGADAANGMAEILYSQGKIQDAFDIFRARLANMKPEGAAIETPSPQAPHRKKHDAEQQAYLAAQLNGYPSDLFAFHLDAGARISEGAVNPAITRQEIEQQWQSQRPQIVVVDNLLTPQALAALRRFCETSTIWQKTFDAGYLGTTPESGFACPLLAQIAEEFPRALPAIFRAHPLIYLWAFKYDSRLKGINIHADFAAVNVNFWITPDEACLDPAAGGLVVWDKAAPLGWDFDKYNTDETAIRRFLEQAGAKPVFIPYRANRAVIFDSDLFHETDRLSFKEGYQNRRINVTLLYGEREKQAEQGA